MPRRPVKEPTSFDPQLRYDVPTASALLRQSIGKTYKDIRAGTLTPIKDGKRCYIPGTEIARRSSLP